MQNGRFISKEIYYSMSNLEQAPIKKIDQMTYLYQVSRDFFMLCNFTSKPFYFYDGKRYTNLKLEDSIYAYATPTVLVDLEFLINFTDQMKERSNLPQYLKNTENDIIIQDTINGFIDSFKFTMGNGKSFNQCPASTTLNLPNQSWWRRRLIIDF